MEFLNFVSSTLKIGETHGLRNLEVEVGINDFLDYL